MKSFAISLMFLLVYGATTLAQTATKNYHFVYIDHEVNTPTNQLCNKLKDLHEDALETEDVRIIYLAPGLPSEGYCMLSLTNLQDGTDKKQDTEEAFNNIIAALQNAKYHSVSPKADVQNIIDLFDTYPYQQEDKNLTYKNVKLSFYVGSRFWTLGYNYSVLSYLYALLDVDSMPKGKYSFNVMVSRTDKPTYEEGMPFGNLNLQGINKKTSISIY